jgi:SprT protein
MSKVAKQRQDVAEGMKKYLPEEFVPFVVELFFESPLVFKVVKGRKSKLGDFKAGLNGERHRITVNSDLNPWSFLITTLHEFAHLHTFERHGRSVLPHGKEWQNAFRKLVLPVVNSSHLPKDIENALLNAMIRVKASSCSDHELYRVLKRYDQRNSGKVLLEQLPEQSIFVLEGKSFQKGNLRRKRYVCEELNSRRQYLVHALAEVTPIK